MKHNEYHFIVGVPNMPLDSIIGLGLGGTFDGSDLAIRQRKSLRTISTRKILFFSFIIVLSLTFMYLLVTKNGYQRLSVFKGARNYYEVDPKKEHKPGLDGNEDDHYCIVFDAGSTGTRIHVLHFRKNKDKNLILLKDIFKETKPGLSSYADQPNKAIDSVDGLLQVAKNYIPQSRWPSSPIVLKATAGLRLLPGRKADIILKKVKKLFMSTLFKKIGNDYVSIMDGDSEGIYGWLSVNYLSAKLETRDLYGALDLGGGSVQITFPFENKGEIHFNLNNEYVKSMDVAKKSYSLYTHSYLGLGLMSARASILNSSADLKGNISNAVQIHSPCFPSGYRKSWSFGSKQFNIAGSEFCSFENCRELAKNVISAKNINKPDELKEINIFAFSYFFDKAVDLGLIDEQVGGQLLVKNYVDAAQTVCQRGNAMEKPFLCLDTTFISTLMTDGFGFKLHHKLQLKRKIQNFDVSWAVGAALHIYEKTRGF